MWYNVFMSTITEVTVLVISTPLNYVQDAINEAHVSQEEVSRVHVECVEPANLPISDKTTERFYTVTLGLNPNIQ